jgi:hypothetical protein
MLVIFCGDLLAFPTTSDHFRRHQKRIRCRRKFGITSENLSSKYSRCTDSRVVHSYPSSTLVCRRYYRWAFSVLTPLHPRSTDKHLDSFQHVSCAHAEHGYKTDFECGRTMRTPQTQTALPSRHQSRHLPEHKSDEPAAILACEHIFVECKL